MILRLVESAILGTPQECMERMVESGIQHPLPDILVYPELPTTGFVLDSIPQMAMTLEELAELPFSKVSREHSIWTVAGTYPIRREQGITNTMAVFDPEGRLIYTTDKVHLFRPMGEDTAFTPGSCGGVFQLGSATAGGIVCYDLRFPELTRRLTVSGAGIIFVPAQWPSGRRSLFRALLRARAAESQVFVAGCNLGGEHLGVTFMGGGGVAHPGGNLLKGTDVVENVTDYDIDTGDISQMRDKINCLQDRRPEEYRTGTEEG